MAAEYGININVRTRTEKLAALNKILKQTQSTAEKLKKELKDIGDQRGRGTPGGPFSKDFADKQKQVKQAVLEAKEAFKAYTKGLVNFDGKNTRSITQLGAFAAKLQEVRRETSRTTSDFQLFTQAITKIGFTEKLSALKRYNDQAKITADTFTAIARGNQPGVAGFQGADLGTLIEFEPANTINAIDNYIAKLFSVRNELDLSEQEYRDVNRRIAEMNKLMRESQKLGLPKEEDKKSQRDRERLLRGRPTGFSAAEYGPQRGINRVLTRNPLFREGGMFFERGGMQARKRNALSSGLIGGGFPLLFGQGVGASVGGGLGGIAGGFLGGGLGFGLSIVGTQLGKQVDVLVQATKATGDALGEFTKDFTVLQKSLGETGTATGKFIELLAQSKGSYEAFLFTQRELTNVIGQEGVDALQKFSDDLRNVNKNFSQFFLKLQSGLAKVINSIGILDGLSLPDTGNLIKDLEELGKNLLASEIKKAQDIRNAQILGFQPRYQEGILKGQIISPADAKERLKLLKEEGSELQKQVILDKQRAFLFENLAKGLQKQKDISDQIGFRERERVLFTQKIAEFTKKYQDALKRPPTPEEIQAFRELLEAQSQLVIGARLYRDELTELDKQFIQLNDVAFQLVEVSRQISDGFKDSFKGIIMGTMSVSEAFRNLTMRIADHFADMAAQMAANALGRMFLGAFSNFFNPIPKISDSGPIGDFGTSGGSFDLAANGGPVGYKNPYIVGERGPELFVPNQSGNIIPNHDLAGIGGGSTNIVVNVDASGSNVQGDEEQGRELGRLISVAVQSEILQQQRPGGLLA